MSMQVPVPKPKAAPKLDPDNPEHIRAAYELLDKADPSRRSLDAPRPVLPGLEPVPVDEVQLGVTVPLPMRALRVPKASAHAAQALGVADAEVLHDGTLRWRSPAGYQVEASPGDLIVHLPTGPVVIFGDEIGLLWQIVGEGTVYVTGEGGA